MHVSSCFSNIYKWLVKDRKSYALHNGRGLIIMQTRTESGKLEHEFLKEGGEGNPAKPGKLPKSDDITMTCMTYEHPHGTPRWENNKLPPEQTKSKYKQNIQTLPSHATWLGSHRSSPHHLFLSLSLLLSNFPLTWIGRCWLPKTNHMTIQPPCSRKYTSLVAWTITLATRLLHTDI